MGPVHESPRHQRQQSWLILSLDKLDQTTHFCDTLHRHVLWDRLLLRHCHHSLIVVWWWWASSGSRRETQGIDGLDCDQLRRLCIASDSTVRQLGKPGVSPARAVRHPGSETRDRCTRHAAHLRLQSLGNMALGTQHGRVVHRRIRLV